MGREFEVRPIMFTFDEVRRWWRAEDGRELGRSSSGRRLRAAPAKVARALPVARREEVERSRVDRRTADRL